MPNDSPSYSNPHSSPFPSTTFTAMARGRKKGKHSWDGYSKKDQASKWLRTLAEAQYQLRRSGSASAAAAAAATSKASAAASNANGGWLQKFRLRHQQGGGGYGSGAGAAAARMNAQAAARFVELYLRGPPPSAAAANLTASVAARGRKGDGLGRSRDEEEDEEDIDLEEWLWREARRGDKNVDGEKAAAGEAEKKGVKEDKESSPVVSLTALCCRQVGADLALYGAACALEGEVGGAQGRKEQGAVPAVGGRPARGKGAAAAFVDDLTGSMAATVLSFGQGVDSKKGTGSTSQDEEEDEEEEEEEEEDDTCENTTADAIRGIFSLLPSECLARISLAASLSHAVTDASLPLLCQPSALRLVLVGSFTDAGLAHAMFPRLRQLPTTASWEDATLEPQLGGCVLLQSLLVSSPRLTPLCVEGVGRHLTTVRSLALPRCFNANVTTTAKDVLSIVGASCGYVQELDLRGCHWLSEKSLVGWVGVAGKTAAAVAAGGGGGKVGGGGNGRGVKEEGEGGRLVLGGREGGSGRMTRVLAFDGPAPECGPPAALHRLYLGRRLANAEVVRRAFAERMGCENGSEIESRKTSSGMIEVSAWEEGGKGL